MRRRANTVNAVTWWSFPQGRPRPYVGAGGSSYCAAASTDRHLRPMVSGVAARSVGPVEAIVTIGLFELVVTQLQLISQQVGEVLLREYDRGAA